MSSHKTSLGGPVTALLTLLAVGCAGDGTDGPRDSNFDAGPDSGVRERELDLGQNWDDGWIEDLERSGRTGAVARGSGAGTAPDGVAGRRRAYWGIVLRSFSAADHQEAAATMVRSCAQIDPRLGRAHVHATGKGSVVVYGIYEQSDSPAAQRDLAWIKEIELNGRPVFARAILSRLTVGPDPDRMNPLALMSVRHRFPNIHPLYTLQVAVWGDFGAGKMSEEELRRRGANDAQRLRNEGHDAYFHYDDNTGLCMVTVGLFDETAIDAQSGLFSPEVEAEMRKFPVNLVNGEPLQETIDSRRPHLGTRVQASQLVLVPK